MVRSRSASPKLASPSPTLASRAQPGKGVNLLFLALALVGSLHVSAMLGVEVWRLFTSRQEIARLSADVLALEQEQSALQAVIDHVGDPLYREQLARCLGFVRPGETRYLTSTDRAEAQPLDATWCR